MHYYDNDDKIRQTRTVNLISGGIEYISVHSTKAVNTKNIEIKLDFPKQQQLLG
jgi:hypothetical protein